MSAPTCDACLNSSKPDSPSTGPWHHPTCRLYARPFVPTPPVAYCDRCDGAGWRNGEPCGYCQRTGLKLLPPEAA